MKKFGIGRKMMIGGVALAVLPLLVIGIFTINESSQGLEALGKEQALKTAQKLAEMINMVLLEELKLARTLATDEMVVSFCSNQAEADPGATRPGLQALSNRLAAAQKVYGDQYEAIIVADRSATVVADSREGATHGIPLSDRDYYQEAIKGKANVGEVVMSKNSNTPITVVAAPVKDKAGNIQGIVGLVLKIDFLVEKIVATKTGETGYPFMVNSDGLTIAHPNKEYILEMNLRDDTKGQMKTIMDQMLAGRTGVESYVFEGHPKVAGFAPVPETGWSLGVTQNKEEFLAPVRSIRNGTIIVGFVFLTIAVIGVIIFSRRISKPLNRATDVADAIAVGDLTQRMNFESRDEIGSLSKSLDDMADGLKGKAELAEQIASGDLTSDVVLASDRDVLGQALQTMVISLNEVLGEVNSSSMQVAAGTSQVSDSSQALSQGATEQAASLEEISSSLTELAAQTKTNAENASQANQLAVGAREKAESGNDQMQEMIGAMSEISSSSKEIAKIIKAIDEIAFQTNLLALNAAVEAARAGKHGKGFAVVAQEVRNLAGRSAKAAQETTELIEGAVKTVESGMEIVNRTASALSEIVDGSVKVADLVGEIASASNEQANGIYQINQGLSQVDQVTQQNTATAEETASASEELSGQAMQLKHLVSRFILKGNSKTHDDRKRERVSKEGPRPLPEPAGRDHWGEDAALAVREQALEPKDFIALDDQEFGRF